MTRRSETTLLAEVRARFRRENADVLLGIGDDAAVLRLDSPKQVVSTDLLVEGVDFPAGTSPRFLAEKSVAASVSDIYASGALPTALFVAVGIPPAANDERIDTFFEALDQACHRWSCVLAGGDLSSAPVWLAATTLWGRPLAEPWLRSGGLPGDELWYFGAKAGRAATGLRLLSMGARLQLDGTASAPIDWSLESSDLDSIADAISGQLSPTPPAIVPELARAGGVHAAIDLSDGLLKDADRLAEASQCSAEIESTAIPLFRCSERVEAILARDPLGDALAGGEDFALLVAVDPRLAADWPTPLRGTGARIGLLRPRNPNAASRLQILRDGVVIPLPESLGFDHFETSKDPS